MSGRRNRTLLHSPDDTPSCLSARECASVPLSVPLSACLKRTRSGTSRWCLCLPVQGREGDSRGRGRSPVLSLSRGNSVDRCCVSVRCRVVSQPILSAAPRELQRLWRTSSTAVAAVGAPRPCKRTYGNQSLPVVSRCPRSVPSVCLYAQECQSSFSPM